MGKIWDLDGLRMRSKHHPHDYTAAPSAEDFLPQVGMAPGLLAGGERELWGAEGHPHCGD